MSTLTMNAGRRISPAARWARTVSGFSLVLGCTAAVGHRYGFVETPAFFWVLALVAGFALLGLLLAAIGFARLWQRGDKAGMASLAAVFLSLIVLTPFGIAGYLAYRSPPLTDVSTDLVEPPQLSGAARDRTAGMNPIRPISQQMIALQRAAYPDVSGRRFDASMERVLSAVQVVLSERGWRSKTPFPSGEFPHDGEIELEVDAPSTIIRLPADAAIRLTDEGESVFVDMRIASRYGQYDLGDKARSIRNFMNEIDAEFTRQSLLIIDIPASSEDEDAVQ